MQETFIRHKFLKHVALNMCNLYPFYILTYLLNPWSGFLLEKLTGSQLVKKFPAFYETRMFITTFTSARQLSLTYPDQSIP